MAEITRALNELVDRPACIGGPSFETFPLTLGTSLRDPRPRTDEQAKFDALAEVGLLSKAGEHSYELTDAGSAVHTDEGQFCFAQGFEIGQITSTEPIPAGRQTPEWIAKPAGCTRATSPSTSRHRSTSAGDAPAWVARCTNTRWWPASESRSPA